MSYADPTTGNPIDLHTGQAIAQKSRDPANEAERDALIKKHSEKTIAPDSVKGTAEIEQGKHSAKRRLLLLEPVTDRLRQAKSLVERASTTAEAGLLIAPPTARFGERGQPGSNQTLEDLSDHAGEADRPVRLNKPRSLTGLQKGDDSGSSPHLRDVSHLPRSVEQEEEGLFAIAPKMLEEARGNLIIASGALATEQGKGRRELITIEGDLASFGSGLLPDKPSSRTIQFEVGRGEAEGTDLRVEVAKGRGFLTVRHERPAVVFEHSVAFFGFHAPFKGADSTPEMGCVDAQT